MTTHAQARQHARAALVALFGSATDGEVAALAGVGRLETSYGDGWKGPGKGSYNMGAIQCGSAWAGLRFSYVDTHPNKDGASTRYQVDFRSYLTPEDGWKDLARVMFVNRGRACVRAAANARDWYGVSKALHDTGYYEGYGRTVPERIANHHRALSRAIAAADGAPAPSERVQGQLPTLRKGARGEDVKLLQRELELAADGVFGPATDERLRYYQTTHGLTSDGACGPVTWAKLLGDDYTPGAA